jgi:dihydrofolate reductase
MNFSKKISVIIATTSSGGIGFNNKLPWNIPEDLRNFKKITSFVNDKTKKNAIIMGRATWESLPVKPLPNRLNIILTNDINYYVDNKYSTDVIISYSMNEALMYCDCDNIENIFIIGGEQIYKLVFNDYSDLIEKIYLTIIMKYYECDKHININNIFENFKISSDDINIYNDYTTIIARNYNNI